MQTPKGGWKDALCRWKSGERDRQILLAFRATEHAVQILLRQHGPAMTLAEAAHIADYIRAQRDLIEQVLERGQPRRVRLLDKKRQRLRTEFLALANSAGLQVDILKERCRTYMGSIALD
ncbi:MAG: hypothetical protein WC353_01695 [Candidatus Peribacter sp.]